MSPSYNGNGKRCRNRKGRLSESEIMSILVCYHINTYRNFQEYYQNCIYGWLNHEFPAAVSYNRFIELMDSVFFKIMLFMKIHAFGKCTGITFVDSTMIPVCHNVRRYFNKILPVLPGTTRTLWAAAMNSNCICFAMIPEKC